MSEPEIICERRGAAGLVTLNRPQALNAITHGMVLDLARALDAWEKDPAVTRIVVQGAGGKAFSAGGDIRALYEAGQGGRHGEALAFWRDEYHLNIRIKRYPKPYVSLIDGIVMGGGVGVSLHGSHRVAGDRYRFAMPEVAIGFFPDVGATYALPRLPGATGMYLALTGARVGPDDAGGLGLATHVVPSGAFPQVLGDLAAGGDVDAVLAAACRASEPGPIMRERAVIDACFSAESVPAILARLDEAAANGSDFARATAAEMRTKAPSSLAIAFEQVRRGRDLSFEEAMATEFRIVSRVVHEPDFYEGVRATIIDKDGAPRWSRTSIDEVDPDWVAAHFAALGPAELGVA
ncbi:enoyl-CoA hydratase/isomerase family protein [Enterovirga aerilata]|uniref:3-hydroxyisobutyryl-CoA hydrolase n=1 Tax=Enterovirga aerilata TaxID=2730920 RepID=A0A849IA62_9HYPH|nr:enoyl-CoA hydratase/isomerase family protein [Enterovirga sp. DB1703]NNM73289.1 enoyl-CoA hydratase/isomerase family protein [Enterovirga sp. DB1703]